MAEMVLSGLFVGRPLRCRCCQSGVSFSFVSLVIGYMCQLHYVIDAACDSSAELGARCQIHPTF